MHHEKDENPKPHEPKPNPEPIIPKGDEVQTLDDGGPNPPQPPPGKGKP